MLFQWLRLIEQGRDTSSIAYNPLSIIYDLKQNSSAIIVKYKEC